VSSEVTKLKAQLLHARICILRKKQQKKKKKKVVIERREGRR